MSRAWKIAVLLLVALLFGMVVSLAWSAPQRGHEPKMPVFSDKDHKFIEDYYIHLLGTLAPGSLDVRKGDLAIADIIRNIAVK